MSRRDRGVSQVAPREQSALRWWIVLWATIMFAPPLPLPFLEQTRSTVSPAILVAGAYLVRRVLLGPFRVPRPRSLQQYALGGLFGFLVAHAVYLAAAGRYVSSLMELQWVVYLGASCSLIGILRRSPQSAHKLFRALLVVLLLEAVAATVSAFTGPLYPIVSRGFHPRFGLGVFRATGTVGNANALGGLMAIALALTVGADRQRSPVPKLVLLTAFVLAVLLSQSKSAILTAGLSVVVTLGVRMFCAGQAQRSEWLHREVPMYGTLFALGSALAVRFHSVFLAALDSDIPGRLEKSDRVLDMFRSADLVEQAIGVGFRGTSVGAEALGSWATAHNTYISFLAEIGLVGLALLVIVLLTGFWANCKRRDWALFGAWGVFVAHCYTETFLYAGHYVLVLVFLCVASSFPTRPFPSRARPRSHTAVLVSA